jgi:hypothetical protein
MRKAFNQMLMEERHSEVSLKKKNFVPIGVRPVLVDSIGPILQDYIDLDQVQLLLACDEIEGSCLEDSPYQELNFFAGIRRQVAYDAFCDCSHCRDCKFRLNEFSKTFGSNCSSKHVNKISQQKVKIEMKDVTCQTTPFGWFSESYAVCFRWRDLILEEFNLLDRVDDFVDVFSDTSNRRFGQWYADAWKEKWDSSKMHWWNPPFSLIGDVVLKILADHSIGIVVAPAWRSENWFKVLDNVSSRRHVISAGEKIFELEGSLVGPTKWDVVFFLLDGGQKKSETARRRERRMRSAGQL